MSFWLRHLPVLPIAIPLVTAATMLLIAEARRVPRLLIAVFATLGQVAAAGALLYFTIDGSASGWTGEIRTYAIGGWAAPFGIVLVVDRLAALMVGLSSLLALSVVVHSTAGWDRLGVHYHPLLQLLLMGLNGAFLTGDLFNLFVFFEVTRAGMTPRDFTTRLAEHGVVMGAMGRRVRAVTHLDIDRDAIDRAVAAAAAVLAR